MTIKLSSRVTACYIIFVRSFIVVTGCIAIWWGISVFHIFFQESSIQRIADRIVAGDPFKADIIYKQLPIIRAADISTYCRPPILHAAAIMRLRMVEDTAFASDTTPYYERLKSLGNVVRSSLSCSPADPFLWIVLFWVEQGRSGVRVENLKYLRMSYLVGPNEGWIGLKRNRLAFAEYNYLSNDLADSAVNEFVGLVKSGFYEQTAEIFVNLSWQVRAQISSRLKEIDARHRRAFQYFVDKKHDDVPGVESKD